MFKFFKGIKAIGLKTSKAITNIAKINIQHSKIRMEKRQQAKLAGTWSGMFGNLAKQRKANLAKRLTLKQSKQEAISRGSVLWKENLKSQKGKGFLDGFEKQREANVLKWKSRRTLKNEVINLQKQLAAEKAKTAKLLGRNKFISTGAPKIINPARRQREVLHRMRERQQAIRAFRHEINEVLVGASSARFEIPGSTMSPESILDRHLAGELSLDQIEQMTGAYDRFLATYNIDSAKDYLEHEIPQIDSIIDRVAFDTHMANWQQGFMSNTGPDAVWESKHGKKDEVWAKIEFEERSRFERAGGDFGAFKELRKAEKANESLKRNRDRNTK